MLERIERWLRYLEGWTRDPGPERAQDWLSSPLDWLHSMACYLRRNPGAPEEVRRRYEAVSQQWLEWRKSNRETYVNGLRDVIALFVRPYEISVESFCDDLNTCPVTRPDVLRQVSSIVQSLADGSLELAYENVLLPGVLTEEDIPERDMTDEMLSERRTLAILTRELSEYGQVPEEAAESIRQSDEMLLETIRKVLGQ